MNISLYTIIVVFMTVTMQSITAQKFDALQKSPTDITYAKTDRNAKPLIKVIYSRPQKRKRKVFGELVPYQKVWRTGADEATEIKFFQDVKLGTQTITAGTYSLFTIPGEKTWEIIINSDLDSWGAYSYKEDKDVTRLTVPVTSGEMLEVFSIGFTKEEKGYHMVLGWDTTRVVVPFLDIKI